jgi:hypothetical protein
MKHVEELLVGKYSDKVIFVRFSVRVCSSVQNYQVLTMALMQIWFSLCILHLIELVFGQGLSRRVLQRQLHKPQMLEYVSLSVYLTLCMTRSVGLARSMHLQ